MNSPSESSRLFSLPVLGVPVCCADYRSASREMMCLAKEPRPTSVAASATHLLTVARQKSDFAEVLGRFDCVLPDGMPVVWSLNLKGAGLRDRVYGPYLMRMLIQQTPAPWKHFFFGGTPACLESLRSSLMQLQPGLQIAGMLSPPFRKWTEEDQQSFANEIRRADPDFIWVALGGIRQEEWIDENRHRFERGVFVGVGDAFELLAGNRPFAPEWMQHWGLTWVYRLYQEPQRLWKRYLYYNTLYVWYHLLELWVGRSDDSGAGFSSRSLPPK